MTATPGTGPIEIQRFDPDPDVPSADLAYTFGGQEAVAQLRPGSVVSTWTRDAFNGAISHRDTRSSAVLDARYPDRVVAARNGSPVVLGIGDKEMFVASDVAALVRYTRQVVHLDDGEVATVTKEREVISGAIPADLLKLYDKLREQQGGIGAAKLYQRTCQGCRQELAITDINEIRAAAPDTVVRCENCRRILVRTAESGL